jgi:allene oxide cyclase
VFGLTRSTTTGVLIAVSIAALTGCTSSGSSASQAGSGTESAPPASETSSAMSFTVIDHVVDQPGVNVAKISARPGAVWPFQDPIYDAGDTDVIGSDLGECVRINVSRGSWECRWTTFLTDGQISVEGPFFDTKPSVLTITGGTGTYEGATGSMDMDCMKVAPNCEYTFNLA